MQQTSLVILLLHYIIVTLFSNVEKHLYCELILGSLSEVLGTFHIIAGVHAIILTDNRFILGAFAIIFGA